MSKKRNLLYKCPFCANKYNKEDLIIHIDDNHNLDIPEDFTSLRYVFNYINKRPITYHGKCTECGGPTPWDDNKGRYNRQCGKKACHDSFIKKFEENMLRTNGVTRISSTAEGQVKMLANRKISGEYKFRNGVNKTYTGTYELKALEFMDKIMHIDPDDIMCPGPILEYTMDNRKFMYITDFYYIPYNLIIEVKDGGDNPNKRNMPEYRAKQIAKEKYIIDNTEYNYLRLTNNDLHQLLAVFMDLKMQLVDNSNDRIVHINENREYKSPVKEMMSVGSVSRVVGIRDTDAYIVNRYGNNVFDKGLCVTDHYFTNVFGLDNDSNLVKLSDDETKEIRESLTELYLLSDYKNIISKISPLVNTKITESKLYETCTGKKLYDYDQIQFNLPKIEFPKLDMSILEKYIYGNDEVDKVINSINEVINNG